MLNAEYLEGRGIEKAKDHPPVSCDSKREKAGQGAGESFCVEERMERVLSQRFEESP